MDLKAVVALGVWDGGRGEHRKKIAFINCDVCGFCDGGDSYPWY